MSNCPECNSEYIKCDDYGRASCDNCHFEFVISQDEWRK